MSILSAALGHPADNYPPKWTQISDTLSGVWMLDAREQVSRKMQEEMKEAEEVTEGDEE
jgi:hypothetical protein